MELDRVDILVWSIAGGFTCLFACIVFGFKFLISQFMQMREESSNNLKDFREETTQNFKELRADIREINEKIHDMDKRIYVIEKILEMEECCMLRSDENLKRVE